MSLWRYSTPTDKLFGRQGNPSTSIDKGCFVFLVASLLVLDFKIQPGTIQVRPSLQFRINQLSAFACKQNKSCIGGKKVNFARMTSHCCCQTCSVLCWAPCCSICDRGHFQNSREFLNKIASPPILPIFPTSSGTISRQSETARGQNLGIDVSTH